MASTRERRHACDVFWPKRMIVELARRVSSCGWVALCERRRAGFARLSGWQPVGNWVASGANFPASLLPVGVIPTTSRESRRTGCVGKWPRSQAESDPAYRRKAETIPRGGGVCCYIAPRAAGGNAVGLDTLSSPRSGLRLVVVI